MNIKPAASQYHRRAISFYLVVVALTALGNGFSDNILSNYFKDAYQVTALQRGLIEFPRELPGVIIFLLVSGLAFLGDIQIAMIAQGLAIVGLSFLGFLTPPYATMLLLVFVQSLGQHIWYPLQDSIGMSLIHDEQNAGRIVGRFKGVSTGFSMLASLMVFMGFRFGFFSFTTPVKVVFLIAVLMYFIALVFLRLLRQVSRKHAQSKAVGHDQLKTGSPLTVIPEDETSSATASGSPLRWSLPKFKFVFRHQYRYYYVLAILFGVQKQIMIVYAPWVLIELLSKKADTLALLSMIGSFIGMFFIPALGRWQDRFGIKKMLYLDAFSFIGVYAAYGFLTAGFTTGFLAKAGLPVILTFILFIIDRMSMQMGMIRSMYLRSIALSPADISPTLTVGQGMDHIVSITCATLGGLVWTLWGAQYVFFGAAFLSLANYVVARLVVVGPGPGET
jgi:hypothetical protein